MHIRVCVCFEDLRYFLGTISCRKRWPRFFPWLEVSIVTSPNESPGLQSPVSSIVTDLHLYSKRSHKQWKLMSPAKRSASVFIVSPPIPLPVSHSLSQPLSTSAIHMKVCVCVCGVISTVARICVCLCVCEQLWILWGMHKRQQHLRDLSRLSKLSIFHSLWLYLCVPMLVCVCVFFWCLCTAANICHRQHSVYSIKYKYIIAE